MQGLPVEPPPQAMPLRPDHHQHRHREPAGQHGAAPAGRPHHQEGQRGGARPQDRLQGQRHLLPGLAQVRGGAGDVPEAPSQRQRLRQRQHPLQAHAEEAGHADQLPAGGGRGADQGHEGGEVAGRAHRHRAHTATSEPPTALGELVGRRPGQGLPIPGTRCVKTVNHTRKKMFKIGIENVVLLR